MSYPDGKKYDPKVVRQFIQEYYQKHPEDCKILNLKTDVLKKAFPDMDVSVYFIQRTLVDIRGPASNTRDPKVLKKHASSTRQGPTKTNPLCGTGTPFNKFRKRFDDDAKIEKSLHLLDNAVYSDSEFCKACGVKHSFWRAATSNEKYDEYRFVDGKKIYWTAPPNVEELVATGHVRRYSDG